jgi:hypothetical protein
MAKAARGKAVPKKKTATKKKAPPKKKSTLKKGTTKKNKLGVKNSLVNNINAKKKKMHQRARRNLRSLKKLIKTCKTIGEKKNNKHLWIVLINSRKKKTTKTYKAQKQVKK